MVSRIEELDTQIREANSELQSRRNALARLVPEGTTLDDYLQWEPVEDVESLISQRTEELQNRQRAVARSEEIAEKSLFTRIELPYLPQEFEAVLDRGLTAVAADAEARVLRHIAAHDMGPQGQGWLSQGLNYTRDARCPFCGGDVSRNELVAAYRSYFGVAYTRLKQDVAQLRSTVDRQIGEGALAAVQETIGENAALLQFWRQFIHLQLPEVSFQQLQSAYTTLRQSAISLVHRKEQDPTEPVVTDADFTAALAGLEELRALVEAYNGAVEDANQRIQEFRTALSSPDSLSELEAELADLRARRERYCSEVVEACAQYQESLARKQELQQQKDSGRRELDRHCENLMGQSEQLINGYLDQFGAGFRLMNTRHLYTGGTPSCHYQIEINNSAVDLGGAQTPPGTPCFKTCLSSGDRSALAFAFFMAVLEQESDIGNKIVVFDDPFTSLDRFRRSCTQQLILHVAARAEQVIVLSHDPHFLAAFREGPIPGADIKPLQMSRSGSSTVIGEWDVDEEIKSSYEKDYSTLLGFARDCEGEPRAVVRAIRPFLEGMLRAHFPGHFLPTEWLGDFLIKIRNATPSSGLEHAKNDLAELEAINDYSKKYHHEQNPNADSELLDKDELHSYVRRTLRLVGGE